MFCEINSPLQTLVSRFRELFFFAYWVVLVILVMVSLTCSFYPKCLGNIVEPMTQFDAHIVKMGLSSPLDFGLFFATTDFAHHLSSTILQAILAATRCPKHPSKNQGMAYPIKMGENPNSQATLADSPNGQALNCLDYIFGQGKYINAFLPPFGWVRKRRKNMKEWYVVGQWCFFVREFRGRGFRFSGILTLNLQVTEFRYGSQLGPNILAEGKLKYLGAFGNCCFVVLSKFQEDNSQLSKKIKSLESFGCFFWGFWTSKRSTAVLESFAYCSEWFSHHQSFNMSSERGLIICFSTFHLWSLKSGGKKGSSH